MRAIGVISPLVRAVEWLFSPRAPGVDIALGVFAFGWPWLMIAKPEMFDRGTLSGLSLLPDAVWITGFFSLVALHGLGLFRLHWRAMRSFVCLVSSWTWLFVAFSLYRVEFSTGCWTYGILGVAALIGSIHIAGQPRRGG